MLRLGALGCAAFAAFAQAATVEFNWSITRSYANPDGLQNRPVISINNEWPLPIVNVTKGDHLIIHVDNQLGNESTSFHFHGIYQNGTNSMDGAVGVTQCGIPPGGTFTYNFTFDQVGTYWYHSHQRGQYPNGLRGPVIVRDPEDPFAGKYDEEVLLTLSDWYHDEMQPLISSFIAVTNPTGAEPVPDAALINDSQNVTFPVQPGKTYMFHIVNMGAFAAHYFWIEGHSMQVIEVDGIWTEPAETDMIYITVAQRYSILVTAINTTDANFPIVGSMDTDLFDAIPDGLNTNVTGYLQYDSSSPLPDAILLDEFDPFDDFTLVPLDHEPLLPEPDQVLTMEMKMDNLGDGANYAFFNDQTYMRPLVPTLYSVLSSPSSLTENPMIYGSATNTFVLSHLQTIDLQLNNLDPGKHPFHLHGHAFQVLSRADDDAGEYNYDPIINASFPSVPMRRDTLLVRPNSNFALRFRADNPGVWLFHCHIEWHVASGLIATIVEAPLQLKEQESVPQDHLDACTSHGSLIAGNAAGKGDVSGVDITGKDGGNGGMESEDGWLDLDGEPLPPPPLPDGWTPRGIAAMTFSVLSAVLGVGVVGWYGAAPIGREAAEQVGRDLR